MDYILGVIILIVIAGLMRVMHKQQVLMNERLGKTDQDRIEAATQARINTWLDGMSIGRDIERLAHNARVATMTDGQQPPVPEGEVEPDDGVEAL